MRSRKYLIFLGILAVGLCVAIFMLVRTRNSPPSQPHYDSAQLQRSIVVPTLHSAIGPGKSAIWCATLQLAWNELRDRVVKAPIQLQGAEQLAKWLNESKVTASVFRPEDYYAQAGWAKDGIFEKIISEMKGKFPRARPNISASGAVAVGYGYCELTATFTTPYFDQEDQLLFESSPGQSSPVHSFGTHSKGDWIAAKKVRDQMQLLYRTDEEGAPGQQLQPREFAFCLDRDSTSYLVTVAVVEPKPTLHEMLDDLQKKIADFRSKTQEDKLSGSEDFAVPNLSFTIDHVESQLSDRPIQNPGYDALSLGQVRQLISFTMDKHGAQVKSEAIEPVKSAPGKYLYICDRPFLIVITKRGQSNPCFVMWVANDELLTKW